MNIEGKLLDSLANTFGSLDHAIGIRLDKSHHKFFAAETRHDVDIATNFLADRIGDSLNDHVTNRMTVSIIHALEMVDIHHQDTDTILATVGAALFGTELFEQCLLVDEPRMAVSHRLFTAHFKLAGTVVGKTGDTCKRLEQFLFMIVIRKRTAAFQTDSDISRSRIVFSRNRHHKNLPQVQVLLFGIVQARQVILEARQEGTFHRTVAHDRKDKDALVGKGKALVEELVGIHTFAMDDMSRILILVHRHDRQAIVGHIGLDIVDDFLVDVIHRHRLEELAQVVVKAAVLLQGDMLLRRIESLVVEHRNGSGHKAQSTCRRIVEGVRTNRIQNQGAHADSAPMVNQRHGHHRLDRGIVHVILQALATGQVPFKNTVDPRAEKLA